MRITTQINDVFPELINSTRFMESDQKDYISDIATTVFDSAVIKLLQTLDQNDQAYVMELMLSTTPQPEIAQLLMEKYDNFEDLITKEIISFKEETIALFGGLEADTGIPVAA